MDAINSMKKQSPNYNFYFYLTWATKIFYVWAKHYIGFFLNYIRFLNGANEWDRQCVYGILISAAFATTIALFLHTLRFKHYVAGTTSFSIYVVSYLSTFIGYGFVFHVFAQHPMLAFITFIGLILNLVHHRLFDVYQIALMILAHLYYRPNVAVII